MSPSLLTGSPGSPPNFELYATQLERLTGPVFGRFGFAAVTRPGLRVYQSTVSPSIDHQDADELWMVGLYHGITQPSALRELVEHDKQVRVFTSGASGLEYSVLDEPPQFHPKVCCIISRKEEASGCLYVSSANLTGAAYGEGSQNVELGISLPTSPKLLAEFDEWWEPVWEASLTLTTDLVDEYANLRHEFFARNPEVPHAAEVPAAEDVRDAQALWIEAGAMSGGSRNQIEFNRELAHFFGEPSDERRDLTILIDGDPVTGKPLTPKRTTFGVDIWRLSLPTSEEGGPEYPERVVRLSKEVREGETVYSLEVADPGSDRHEEWKRLSNRLGYIGQTSGRRRFGLFAAAE